MNKIWTPSISFCSVLFHQIPVLQQECMEISLVIMRLKEQAVGLHLYADCSFVVRDGTEDDIKQSYFVSKTKAKNRNKEIFTSYT